MGHTKIVKAGLTSPRQELSVRGLGFIVTLSVFSGIVFSCAYTRQPIQLCWLSEKVEQRKAKWYSKMNDKQTYCIMKPTDPFLKLQFLDFWPSWGASWFGHVGHKLICMYHVDRDMFWRKCGIEYLGEQWTPGDVWLVSFNQLRMINSSIKG